LSSFISTSERQSIASADRKGKEQMGRQPDIMFVLKYLEVFFELLYVECSRLYCTQQKKKNDEIKLWRETNDGAKDKANVHRYYHLQFAEIPVQLSDANVVAKFIETLLRNILIINVSLLYHASIFTSQRQMEDSTTVSTSRDDY
ncbi:13654_t:CDS:2, partial [Ambispora leptoticha]